MSRRDSAAQDGRIPAPLWSLEPRSSSSSAEQRNGWGERPAEKPSALLTALSELKQDLRELDRKCESIRESKAHQIHAADQQQKLKEPLSDIDAGLIALRDAARARFEAIEQRLAVVALANVSLTERVENILKPQVPQSPPAPPAAKPAAVEWGMPAPSKLKDVEAELSFAKPVIVSPLRSTRRRSVTPEEPPAKRWKRSEPTDAPAPPSAVSLPEVKPRSRALPPGFSLPDWASEETQSKPLPIPEAEELKVVIKAFRKVCGSGRTVAMPVLASELKRLDATIYQRRGTSQLKHFLPKAQAYIAMFLVLPPGKRDLKDSNGGGGHILINDLDRPWNSRVVSAPGFEVQLKELCSPMRPLRVQLDERSEQQASSSSTPLRAMASQPYSAPAAMSAPRSETDDASSFVPPWPAPVPVQELGAPQSAAFDLASRLGGAGPSASSAAAHSLDGDSEQDKARYEGFPPLRQPLLPEMEARLAKASYFYPLVDLMRRLEVNGEVNAGELHNGLRRSMEDEYELCLRACEGTQRFFGVAANLVNFVRSRMDYRQNYVFLRDPDHPFHSEDDNLKYFEHLEFIERGGGHAAPGRSSASSPKPMRQWGKAES